MSTEESHDVRSQWDDEADLHDLTPKTKSFAIRAAVVASNGGLLFGYDIGIAAGVLPMLKDEGYTDEELQLVVALLVVGGVIGGIISGVVCDSFGRRTAIMITCVLFMGSALLLALAGSKAAVYVGRVIVGVAVSMSAVADVSYLTEVAPLSVRGAMVSANELAISIGVLIAYSVGFALKDYQGSWHAMFGVSGVLAFMQAVAMCWMPESPRWLAAQGRDSEALTALDRIYDIPEEAAAELRRIDKAVAAAGHVSLNALVSEYAPQLGLSLALVAVQQVTANANLLNYLPEILEDAAPLSRRMKYGANVFLGVVKVAMTALAVFKVDEVGRRPLLLRGSLVIVCGLLALSVSLAGSLGGTVAGASLAFAACVVVVAAYAASFGPVTWLVVSEMFPDALRGSAVGVALVANWLAQLLVTGCFLTMLAALQAATFLIFALASALGFVLLWRYVPETRRRDFQQIAVDLRRRCAPCCCFSRRWLPVDGVGAAAAANGVPAGREGALPGSVQFAVQFEDDSVGSLDSHSHSHAGDGNGLGRGGFALI